MSDLHDLDDDSYLLAFHDTLTPLMRRATLPKALDFASEQLRAHQSGSAMRVSHLYSIQGSILAALGRDDEALAAYRQAESRDPTIQHKLALANHLIYWHDQPAEALTKAEEAIALAQIDEEGRYHHLAYARGLRGVALLKLGNQEAARSAWSEIVAAAAASDATPHDQDLFLASALIQARLLLPEVKDYLRAVSERAAATDSYDLPQRCASIQAKLDAVFNE